jgi:hypothetical protein
MKVSRWSMNTGGGWLIVVALLNVLGRTHPTQAAELACATGDVPCLIEAIHVANTTGEATTITLAAGTYTLTAVDNTTDGPNGLPSVTSPLTLQGTGAASTIIERAAGAPQFRLLHVAATGMLTLEGLTLQGGDLAGLADDGGGVLNRGTLTIAHSLLQGHTASTGGGIFSIGSVTLTHSTLSGNTASQGGGIGGFTGRLTITNSTLTGNTASGDGGGIHQLLPSVLTLTNSTVSGNTASQGGGIRGSVPLSAPPPQAILRNTILAGNTASSSMAGPDCAAPIISQGHNLIGDPTGCNITLAAGDRTGDPGLGTFTDDGTPGQGYVPLLPTSRAIDAGDPAACPASDQLGQQRVTPCDIGAVEFAPVTLTLGLNQATVRPGDTLRVRLGIHTRGPTVTADASLGVLLPDGMTVLFVTSLAPLDGVVTRLDADPRTFAPLATAYDFPPGLEVTVEDYFVYAVTGDESPGSYAIFTLLTPPGAFADGQVDAGDLRALTLQPFTISP